MAKTAVEKDLVVDSLRKALRVAKAAQKEGYEDVRTNGTVCTDHLDWAVQNIEAALLWINEYRQEEKKNERAAPAAPKKPKEIEECDCGNEIEPDDVAICGGCDKPTCPDCMGDDGICIRCEEED